MTTDLKAPFTNKSLILFALVLAVIFLSVPTSAQPTASDNCFDYNTTTSVCEQCIEGFYLQYWFCVPCKPLCKCYNQNDYCEECLSVSIDSLEHKSYHDTNKDQCFLCSQKIEHCLECKNQNFCEKCYNGTILIEEKDLDGITTGKICDSTQTCGSNCQICSSKSHCQMCKDGYFLQGNGQCTDNQCHSDCQNCSSTTECQVCADGYFLETLSDSSTQCSPCIDNCTVCIDSDTCETCIPSYNFQNGSCQNNGLSNCVNYASDFTVCLACEPGYEVTGGSCSQCSGCDLCTEQFICTTECLEGFYQFNYACIANHQNLLHLNPLLAAFVIFSTFLF